MNQDKHEKQHVKSLNVIRIKMSGLNVRLKELQKEVIESIQCK